MIDTLLKKIEELKEIASRMKTVRVAAEKAVRKRDASLCNFLDSVRRVWSVLLKDKIHAKKLLSRNFRKLPKAWDTAGSLIRHAYPDLDPRTRSKYAAVVRYAEQIGWSGSIKKLLRKDGGINGCVEKEAKLRKPAKAQARVAAKPRKVAVSPWGKEIRHAESKKKTAATLNGKRTSVARLGTKTVMRKTAPKIKTMAAPLRSGSSRPVAGAIPRRPARQRNLLTR